jgi:hypothetical protein
MLKEKLSPLFQLRNYILDFHRDDKKVFLGQVLTIIDAAIADPQQRKGIKDLIQDAFYQPNYREDGIRDMLVEFARLYCKDLELKTKEDEDSFRGRITCSEEENFPCYFN